MATSDDEWQPPTEAELKVIEARRERQSQISKLLGAYLLKGYKMLGETCATCETIVLQDRQNVKYCVACNELDSDNTKDNPALSEEAARRQAEEQSQRSATCDVGAMSLTTGPHPCLTESARERLLPAHDHTDDIPSATAAAPPAAVAAGSECLPLPVRVKLNHGPAARDQPSRLMRYDSGQTVDYEPRGQSCCAGQPVAGGCDVLVSALTAVQGKLAWASAELTHTTHVERSQQLCLLIKTCVETLESLHRQYKPRE